MIERDNLARQCLESQAFLLTQAPDPSGIFYGYCCVSGRLACDLQNGKMNVSAVIVHPLHHLDGFKLPGSHWGPQPCCKSSPPS